MLNARTIAAYYFFRQHAGAAAGALELARAEAFAAAMGWRFEWSEEESDHCILRDASGELLGSLWGIEDRSPNACRVVEAEMAQEAIALNDRAFSHELMALAA